MTQPQPPLDYRTPKRQAPTPLRIKMCRHALGNGVLCIVIAIPLAATLPPLRMLGLGGLGPVDAAIWALLCGNAGAYFAAGVLYILASTKSRESHAGWDKLLFISNLAHMGMIVLTLASLILLNGHDRRMEAPGVMAYLLSLPLLLVLGHMLNLVFRVYVCGD